MANKLKLAILGFGRSGSSLHADAIAASEQFDIVAVCDIDKKRLDQAKARFGSKGYEDYHKMVASEKPDLISVVTRSDQHCQMVCDCLEEGVNVLVTKPWARDAQEGQKMADTARRTGRKLLPWLPARWCGDLIRLREIVQSGILGKVWCVRRVQPSFAVRSDWQTRTASAGGYLLNWGPHLVDHAVQVTGGKAGSAFARMKHLVNSGDAEDAFFAAMTLDNGVLAIAEYTFAPPIFPHWIIQGDAGAVSVTNDHATIYVGKQVLPPNDLSYGVPLETWMRTETIKQDWAIEAKQIYVEVAQDLRGEKPFVVKPEYALELSKTLDAIRQSDKQGQVVAIK